jgi:hypothetical protein
MRRERRAGEGLGVRGLPVQCSAGTYSTKLTWEA